MTAGESATPPDLLAPLSPLISGRRLSESDSAEAAHGATVRNPGLWNVFPSFSLSDPVRL